eukprot:310258-Rhodomonas_salina.3
MGDPTLPPSRSHERWSLLPASLSVSAEHPRAPGLSAAARVNLYRVCGANFDTMIVTVGQDISQVAAGCVRVLLTTGRRVGSPGACHAALDDGSNGTQPEAAGSAAASGR